jgi:hypothetical protein
MKKILLIGLVVSIISMLFNVYIYTFFANKISEKENDISFLRERNLVLSNEFNHAEHFEFFSDYYSLEIETRMVYENANLNSVHIKNLFIKKDRALIKALNYAYNSTVLDPLTDYDSTKLSEIKEYITEFSANAKSESTAIFDNDKVNQILVLYTDYYTKHEKLIKKNNEEISNLNESLSDLKKRFGISKGIALSLQIAGLILVFLKDYKS